MARRNPGTATTVIAAVVSGIVGMSVGYALSRHAMGMPQWTYWIEQDSSGNYVPVIQGPNGERYTLEPSITDFGAQNDAIRAIEDRGGVAVPGKPA